jgi:ribonuclease P protein component
MKRKNRLTSTTEFRRVRRTGNSYAHPLVLLIASPSTGEQSRCGVTASRAIGGAVARNRAKRRMRAALREINIGPGWDLILVARPGLGEAPWPELIDAVQDLLAKAGVIGKPV